MPKATSEKHIFSLRASIVMVTEGTGGNYMHGRKWFPNECIALQNFYIPHIEPIRGMYQK